MSTFLSMVHAIAEDSLVFIALGAYIALLAVDARREVGEIAGRMTYLELSADNSFMDEYTSALFLPHTDLDAFPTVRALLEA